MNKSFDEKNMAKSRRVCAAMAEAASTGKRVLTERESRILDMWPKFEDGEYVWFGDSVEHDGTTETVQGFKLYRCGPAFLSVVGVDTEKWLRIDDYKSVKRPVQSVLDADGAEIEVGDNLYDTYTGCMRTVRAINANGTIEFEGHDNRGWFTKFLTHRAPVLAADGLPLREGETVWHEDGSEWIVEEMNRYGARCFDGDRRRTFDPRCLTHTRPDSWERLEEDAQKNACDYFGVECDSEAKCRMCPHFQDDSDCSLDMNADIIRRAKKLAGVDE